MIAQSNYKGAREWMCKQTASGRCPSCSKLGRFCLLLAAVGRYCSQPCQFVGRELQPATPTACESSRCRNMPVGGITDKLGSGAIVRSFIPERVCCVCFEIELALQRRNITRSWPLTGRNGQFTGRPTSKTVGWAGESGLPLAANHGIFASSVHLQSALATKGATPSRLPNYLPSCRPAYCTAHQSTSERTAQQSTAQHSTAKRSTA